MSILGKGCRELVSELDLQIVPIFSTISTASGPEHRLLGKIKSKVEFKDKTGEILHFIYVLI